MSSTETQFFTPIDRTHFEARNIFLTGVVNSELSHMICRELLAMEKADSSKAIKLWINSPGGEVQSGFAIYDLIQLITCPVYTIVNGMAASMGSVIALAAEKERRMACANAKFLLHQPLIGGTLQGPASDLEIHARDIIELKKKMHTLYAKRTGTAESVFRSMMERDSWVSPESAVELGLVSRIIQRTDEIIL